MTRILDFSEDSTIASEVLALLDGEGFTPEQIVAGLVLAIRRLAGGFESDQIIDEAIDALDMSEYEGN